MQAVILVVHLIVALAIIAIVLVQPSEAGGFLGSGSMSNMMAPRRSGDVLTRLTTILAGIFFLTSLSLAIIAEHSGPAKSILDALPASNQPKPAIETAPAQMAPEPDASKLKTVAPANTAPAKPAASKKEKPSAPISH
jgi:preprotein translocase subunit SecG